MEEIRSQMSEGRGQRTKGRMQRAEVRGQRDLETKRRRDLVTGMLEDWKKERLEAKNAEVRNQRKVDV